MPPQQEESWGHHFQSLWGLQSQHFSCLHKVTGFIAQDHLLRSPPGNLGPSSLPGPEKGPLEPALSFKGPGWSNVDELDVRCTKGGCCSEGSIRSQRGLCPKGKAPPPG